MYVSRYIPVCVTVTVSVTCWAVVAPYDVLVLVAADMLNGGVTVLTVQIVWRDVEDLWMVCVNEGTLRTEDQPRKNKHTTREKKEAARACVMLCRAYDTSKDGRIL